jgi:hypothetical protein
METKGVVVKLAETCVFSNERRRNHVCRFSLTFEGRHGSVDALHGIGNVNYEQDRVDEGDIYEMV